MPDLATPTGEVVSVGSIDVVMLADANTTAALAAVIEDARQAAGTTSMVPGNRQRYSLVVDSDAGQFGLSVHG